MCSSSSSSTRGEAGAEVSRSRSRSSHAESTHPRARRRPRRASSRSRGRRPRTRARRWRRRSRPARPRGPGGGRRPRRRSRRPPPGRAGQSVAQRRVGVARADAVGADPVGAVIDGERAGEVDDGRLGGGVGGRARPGDEAPARADRHDRPAAALAHGGDRGPAEAKRGGQVERERPVPVGVGRLLSRPPDDRPGGRDEPRRCRRSRRARARRRRAPSRRQPPNWRSPPLPIGAGLGVAIDQAQLEAVRRQPPGRRRPYPGRGAGGRPRSGSRPPPADEVADPGDHARKADDNRRGGVVSRQERRDRDDGDDGLEDGRGRERAASVPVQQRRLLPMFPCRSGLQLKSQKP